MIRESIAKFFKVDDLIGNLTGYVETRIELLKIEAKEDLTKGLARLILYLAMAFVFALFILLISIGVAWKIGEFTGPFAGFAIVAGFYLLVGIALALARESLTKKVEKQLEEAFKKKK